MRGPVVLAAAAVVWGLDLLLRQQQDSEGATVPKQAYNPPASHGGTVMQLTGPVASWPRGIRNNNPGNIEANGTSWQGMTGDDGRFAIFSEPFYGIRALARILKTYRDKYNLVTVRQIINRWAPATENNTGAYISSVAGRLGVSADDRLSPSDYPALVTAIIRHENGVQSYGADIIEAGTWAGLA